MSAPPTLTEKLANVQHMPSLIAATIASEKPTDLYLMRDIVKMSYESIQTRVFLQKYFTNLLLTSRNVYVKVKVLKIIVFLLEEGHPDFHRNLQKTPEAFKDASKIKTTDISMAGDCGRIRDLANKVLDMLYEEPPDTRQCPYGAVSSSNSTPQYGGGGGVRNTGGALGGRIQGFGTTSSSSQQSSTVTDHISNAVGTLLGTAAPRQRKNLQYDPKYATMDYIPQSSSVGRMGGGSGGSTNYTNQSGGLPYTNVGSEHRRGRPGGGWDDQNEPVETTTTTVTPTIHNGDTASTTPTSATDNEQERRLVEEITTPGGVRVAPPKDDLKKFILRCKSLDCLAVVEFLQLKLQSDNSQVVSRTLFVVEALIRSDIPDVFSYLDLILDELTQLSTSSQPSIKAKSTKLLHQLSAVESLTLNSSTKSEKASDDLVEVGGVSSDNDNAEQPSEFSALFSGLTLNPEMTQESSKKPSSAYKKPSSKPTTAVPSSSSGLLEGLTFTDPPPSSKTPPTSHQDNLLDFGSSEDNFDPLLSENDSVGKPNDPLGGLLSLDESVPTTQSTTPSTVPLEPTQTTANVTSLLNLGQAGTPPFQLTTPPALTTAQVPMMQGPVISGPPAGVYQPTVYMPQTQPSMMMYNQVLNRPVQMMPAHSQTGESDSGSTGFGFLSKSSGKAEAFDFVQQEMKSASKK